MRAEDKSVVDRPKPVLKTVKVHTEIWYKNSSRQNQQTLSAQLGATLRHKASSPITCLGLVTVAHGVTAKASIKY